MGISKELADGIVRHQAALRVLVAALGGLGARVVGTTPDGVEHDGVLESATIDGLFIRVSPTRRIRIGTSWERRRDPDPGDLRAEVRRLARASA